MSNIINAIVALAILFLVYYCSIEVDFFHFAWKRNEIDPLAFYYEFFTGNLTHYNFTHFSQNAVAFIIIWLLFFAGFGENVLVKIFSFICSALATTLGVYFFTNVEVYTGLSGALHGLALTAGLLRLLTEGDRKGIIIVLLVVGKVAFEYYYPTLSFHELSQQLYGDVLKIESFLGNKNAFSYNVCQEAHIAGCVGGVVATAISYIFYLTRPKLIK
ncbi:MAG: hypothetical protein ACI4V7_06225 [Succinivibrionaceae bacterium]